MPARRLSRSLSLLLLGSSLTLAACDAEQPDDDITAELVDLDGDQVAQPMVTEDMSDAEVADYLHIAQTVSDAELVARIEANEGVIDRDLQLLILAKQVARETAGLDGTLDVSANQQQSYGTPCILNGDYTRLAQAIQNAHKPHGPCGPIHYDPAFNYFETWMAPWYGVGVCTRDWFGLGYWIACY